jgi:hypothetical protein
VDFFREISLQHLKAHEVLAAKNIQFYWCCGLTLLEPNHGTGRFAPFVFRFCHNCRYVHSRMPMEKSVGQDTDSDATLFVE